MIIDKIQNASLYYGISKRIETALKFLENNDFSNMECGKYDIEGSDVYLVVQSYESKYKENALYEAHRSYIDIQYVEEGAELMGYANIGSLKAIGDYDELKDFILYKGDGDFFLADKGTFAIFGPQDAHMPGVAVKNPSTVKKIIVKVKV